VDFFGVALSVLMGTCGVLVRRGCDAVVMLGGASAMVMEVSTVRPSSAHVIGYFISGITSG